MNLAVWIREIWDTRDLTEEIVGPSGEPRWDRLQRRMDPEDLNALEMALQITERVGGQVTALSVGEPDEVDVLREGLYRGVGQAIRLGDNRQFKGNLWAEARLISAAVSRLGEIDLLLTGNQVNEGEGPQKAGIVAGLLGWPLISYVEAFEEAQDRPIAFTRAIEGGIQRVEVRCPAVVSVGVALLKDDPRAPRAAKAKLKLQHKKTPIPCWGLDELGLNRQSALEDLTPIASYRELDARTFPSKRVDGSDEGALKAMLEELSNQGILR